MSDDEARAEGEAVIEGPIKAGDRLSLDRVGPHARGGVVVEVIPPHAYRVRWPSGFYGVYGETFLRAHATREKDE